MLLLDTDVMIDVLRRFPAAVAWLAVQSTEEVVLPGFVVLELLQGCRDKADQDRVERLVAGGGRSNHGQELTIHRYERPPYDVADAFIS